MLRVKGVRRTSKQVVFLVEFDWEGEVYEVERAISLSRIVDMSNEEVLAELKERIDRLRAAMTWEQIKERMGKIVGVDVE
mgnify:FL=1